MKPPGLRSLVAVPGIVLATIVAGVASIACAAAGHRGRGIEFISRNWGRVVAAFAGMRLVTHAMPNIIGAASYVVVSNHQSLLDVSALFMTSPVPLRMLGKKSLFRIPIFGWAMSAVGHIPIDRQKGRTDFQALSHSCERLRRHGHSIMVFPEGTRSRDGELKPFRSGAFHIAANLNLPLVPVSILGTRDVLPMGSLRMRAGEVRILWHAPISPEGRNADELAALARSAIEEGLRV